MTLAEVVDQYIAWRQARGTHFRSGASVLRLYCQSVGGEIDCDAVGTEPTRVFLAGTGPLTRYRANKRTVLAGFYRYAISRGHATHSPLPADEPKEPSSAPPYIYSRDELRRLLAAVDGCRKQAVQLQADTFRTLLLLLYGAGLRGGEALRLTRADVDLSGALLTVRETKFYKSRLVPLGSHLTDVLGTAAADEAGKRTDGREAQIAGLRGAAARLFKMCEVAAARVPSLVGKRVSPHVIRHTTATHLLRAGTIRAWLGHAKLDTTNIYVEIDLETKAKAIALCDATEPQATTPWREDTGLMAFLRTL